MLLAVPAVLIASQANAQEVTSSVFTFSPQFFFSVLAGILLAAGFQLVLTLLSTASGISAIGNVEKMRENKSEDEEKKTDSNTTTVNKRDRHGYYVTTYQNKDEDKDKNETPLGVKISSGVGIWTLVTYSVSVFFASFVAVRLSLIPDNTIGLILGLVIWAGFTLLAMYAEMKSINAFMSGLINMASKGFKAGVDAVSKMFETSPETQMAKVAENTIDAVKNKLFREFDTRELSRQVDSYIEKLKPRELNYDQIKNDLKGILNDIEIQEKTEMTDKGIISRSFLNVVESHPAITRSQAKKLKQLYKEVSNISSSDDLLKAAESYVPGAFRDQLGAYLKATGKEELNPENLKKDLEKMMRDPMSSKEILKNKIRALDKRAVVSALAERQDMSRQEAEKVVGYVETAFNTVAGTLGMMKEESGNMASDTSNAVSDTTAKISNALNPSVIGEKLESRIRTYFDSLERDELNYDRLKMDFETILNDPSVTFEVLKNRFSSFDRETLIALLSSSDNITREDAERIVMKVEEAKNNVLRKAEDLEMRARQAVEDTKRRTLYEAEKVRKTAASAAWWAVATIVISGFASALGGMLAM